MTTKTCKNCGKPLLLDEESFKENPYLRSNFKLKKYCNKGCRIEYNNKLKGNIYILCKTEHDKNVYEINKILQGRLNSTKNKANYNPDIVKENTEFEVELFRKTVHLRNKARKWDKSKKHTLIVCISQHSLELFDTVMFFDKGKLIKVK